MREKARSNKRAKQNVTSLLRLDMSDGALAEVAAIHCNNGVDVEIWKDELLAEFPTLKVI